MDRNAGKAPYMENAVVALRKESVDRNFKPNKSRIRNRNVALRKESVDRNKPYSVRDITGTSGRSPQGERG